MKKFLTQFATDEDGAITAGALDRINVMWEDVDTAIAGIGS